MISQTEVTIRDVAALQRELTPYEIYMLLALCIYPAELSPEYILNCWGRRKGLWCVDPIMADIVDFAELLHKYFTVTAKGAA